MSAFFTVVGMIPVALDVPGFGTPLFRDEQGQYHYVQNLRKRSKIVGFQFVGEIPAERIVRLSQNEPASIGDRMLVGFRYPDGSAIVDTKGAVLERLLKEEKKFRDFPYFYFYLARHAPDTTLMREALKHPQLRVAVRKGWISVPRQYKFLINDGWTQEETNFARERWESGASATEIGRKLGKSRNAVISKVHRLGLLPRKKGTKKVLDFGQSAEMFPLSTPANRRS